MTNRIESTKSKPIRHRGIHAPHLLLKHYPVDRVHQISADVLAAQEQKWKGGGAGTPTPVMPLPVVPESDGNMLRPTLLSSAHGKIKRIQLSFPAPAGAAAFLQGLYTRFIKAFPDVEFVIVTQPSVKKMVEQIRDAAGAKDRTDILLAPHYLSFTLWAEDPFCMARDETAPDKPQYLLKPYTFVRHGDDLVADLVSRALTIRHTQLPIVFQGGNVLVADKFVLLGVDYLSATSTLVDGTVNSDQVVNVPQGDTPIEFAKHLFRAHFDASREFIYVGTKLPLPQGTTVNDGATTQTLFDAVGISQPIFHIDMFITLAGRTPQGRYRIVVGSPALADQLLKRPPLPQALNAQFDDIANTLAGHADLEVVRSPLPLEGVLSGTDYVWYYATTNNCLVEISDDTHKRVWVPQYGFAPNEYLKTIDDYVADMWKGWGFDVVGLGDFREMAQCSGAANCMKKVLERA